MPRKLEGEWMKTSLGDFFVPDIQIKHVKSEYSLLPAHGFSTGLVVFDAYDNAIGWVDTRTLGFENARAWMKAAKFEG